MILKSQIFVSPVTGRLYDIDADGSARVIIGAVATRDAQRLADHEMSVAETKAEDRAYEAKHGW